jgi:hypothetical protein
MNGLTDGTEYVKAYLPNQYVPADIAIADGDRVFGKHSRIVTPSGGLNTVYYKRKPVPRRSRGVLMYDIEEPY